MRFVRISLSLSLLVLSAFSIRTARAQDDPNFENGLKPFGSYHAGNIDHINLSNDALNVDIPLISYPQRGGKLKLEFVLHYHNSGFYSDCGEFDSNGNCEYFSYSNGGVNDSGWNVMEMNSPISTIDCNSIDFDGSFNCTGELYTPDGGVHQILPTTTPSAPWRTIRAACLWPMTMSAATASWAATWRRLREAPSSGLPPSICRRP